MGPAPKCQGGGGVEQGWTSSGGGEVGESGTGHRGVRVWPDLEQEVGRGLEQGWIWSSWGAIERDRTQSGRCGEQEWTCSGRDMCRVRFGTLCPPPWSFLTAIC